MNASTSLVDSWRELADTVAERAVAIGYWPDGQAPTVATVAAQQTKAHDSPVEDRMVLRLLARRLAEVSERTRARLARVGDLDLVSQDVMIEVVRELEQQLWMSRAQLAGQAPE
jgi:starvation-inducible DNA-binding protein